MKQTICILFLLLTSALHGQQGPVKTRVDIVSTPKRVEFSPTISADGRTMIYESQNGDKWELFQSILRDGNKWSTPVALTAINGKCDFIGGPSLSYDGNTLYYTAFIKGVTKNEDIYYSTRLGDERWSEPKSIGRPVNTDEEYEGFPSVSADGQSLYFIRQNKDYEFDRKSKEACFKIWMSRKLADGTWGEPQVLPEPVNTGCERDPRIMADNHTLIFSSIREEGMGKYDLFQSRLSANGTWDEPVPLDFVNSEENDQSPCISASGDHMYYYSDKDIYEITIPREYRQLINVTLLGKVTAGPESTPVKSVIVVQNVKEGNSYFTQSNPNDGRYSIVMSAGQTYNVTFSAAGFRPAKLTFDYSNETTYREEAKDVNLSSLWPFKLVIRDKDMPANVKAMLSVVRDDNKAVFSDSIAGSDMPKELALETNHQYTVGVSAPAYAPLKKDIKFVSQLFHEGRPDTLLLEHEHVKVVADVTEGVNGPKKRVKVTFRNEDTGEVIVADAGEVVNLRKGDRYQVMTSSDKGYSYAMESFVAADDRSAIPLPIVELKEGTKLSLKHIYFQTNSSDLNSASTTELDQIVYLMKQNPEVVIEISAHTDDVGSDAYNDNLSQKRAHSVTQYLVSKGIPVKQLVSVGYGKRKPIVPNDSDEHRAMNRRVEMLVLRGTRRE